MDIVIEIKQTEAYYEEVYQESVKHRLKYRKWQPFIIGCYFLFSAILFLYIMFFLDRKSYIILPILLFIFALQELYDNLNSKRKWLNDRKGNGVLNKIATIRFKDAEIEHSGSTSKGVISWNGFQNVQETEKGLF